ncbi:MULTISPECIES: phosphatase PAP2 family protein [Bacillus]|uniref:phosphatase PAP2 family protein n=1 Tax=Bacillus TaxID=1386 RepID=UPI000BB85990|nr:MULTISPECIES: phosphatase PAP2 family protein [Bacillus]
MDKLLHHFYEMECHLFRLVNQHFHNKMINRFFQTITHVGGATLSISSVLLIILLTSGNLKFTAMSSLLALTVSHIPVAIAKKIYPRRRPYLALDEINVTTNPLKDHSFPSGHTTAIFSIITPFLMYQPALLFILLPIAVSVGISRIYLGLHYPSDVLAGALLGGVSGVVAFTLVVLTVL